MYGDHSLTAQELSELAEVRRDEMSKVLKRAHIDGKPWRKTNLVVKWNYGNGGKQRVVEVESLPEDLKRKWNVQQAMFNGVDPDQVDEFIEVSESAKARKTNQQLDRKIELSEAEERWLLATEAQQAKAKNKLEIVVTAERVIASGNRVDDALREVAAQYGCSKESIYKWRKILKGWPKSHRLYALLDNHGGGAEKIELCDRAWEYIKADYLRLEAPALTAVYDRAKRQGYLEGWKLPSYKTVSRRIKELNASAVVLARQGRECAERLFPAQTRDKSELHALQAVNADGHRFDVFVDWGDGEIGRPMMCAWQDIYSDKILSYRVAKTENSDSIRLSFGDMIGNYGIPKEAYLDNGRGFASKWMTGGMKTRFRFKIKEEEPRGIMTSLGVQVHWAIPHHGQSKPIERAFRDMCEYIAKHPAFAGAYTGNNPENKPDNYGSAAVPIELFLEVLDMEIAAHNAREGRRSPVCDGRSFDQAFEESYKSAPIQQASASQKVMCLMAAEAVKVNRENCEIQLRKNRYWDEALAAYRGQKLTVRFDPDDLHRSIWVYTPEGKFITIAACVAATGFNDTSAAREHARKRNQFVKAAKQQLAAMRDMDALEATIPNVSVDNPERIHITVSKPLKEVEAQAISEEQLDAPRMPVIEEASASAPSKFNNRLKGFMNSVRENADHQTPPRRNRVHRAIKEISNSEVSQ